MNKSYWIVFILFIGIFSCVPPTNEVIMEVDTNFQNPEMAKLYDYIDRQEIDSILSYTSHPNPAFRALIGTGMSAIKSELGLDSLKKLLQDPIIKVRTAAAYAIGQIENPNGVPILLDAFKEKDTININNSVNATVLEAVGKTGDENLLRSLATVTTYRNTDTLLLLGQTRAIYRYSLRGITIPEATDLMVEYITDNTFPPSVRLMAAHYLQRSKNVSIEEHKFRIADAFINEKDINIKMALASCLSKTQDKQIYNVLVGEFKEENDYRLNINILKSLKSFRYIDVIEIMLKELENSNIHIATTASEYLVTNGNGSDATIYKSFLKDEMPFAVKANIYSAVLNNIPSYYVRTKALLRNEITAKIDSSNNAYEKSAYIKALSYDPLNYDALRNLGWDGHPIVRSSVMEGLGRILRNKKFASTFRGGTNRAKRAIVAIIKEGILTKDAGIAAIAGNILADESLGLKRFVTDATFLQQTIDSLELPREIETYNSLKGALASLNGETFSPEVLPYNHPIDWAIVNGISDSTVVAIRTTKGVIKLKLYRDLTPGSVANFVSLIENDFYDQKVFHRVVPNFVIQTGCPRGDGYGSLDYSIRSELPEMYYDQEGYVGMASAGNHTEGTQWFITHSPTPHLDGNYTIFGKVIEGMNVVHNIVQGDKIQDIIITNR